MSRNLSAGTAHARPTETWVLSCTHPLIIENLIDLSYGVLLAFLGLCRLLLWLGPELSLIDAHGHRNKLRATSLLDLIITSASSAEYCMPFFVWPDTPCAADVDRADIFSRTHARTQLVNAHEKCNAHTRQPIRTGIRAWLQRSHCATVEAAETIVMAFLLFDLDCQCFLHTRVL